MPRELKAVIRYGIRQTPSRAVLDKPLAFSAVKSNTSAGKPESATLDSMSGIIRVVSGLFLKKERRERKIARY